VNKPIAILDFQSVEGHVAESACCRAAAGVLDHDVPAE
jgi:hypothetical protein